MTGLFDLFDEVVLEKYNITLEELNKFEASCKSSELNFVILAAFADRKIEKAKEIINKYI